jgi:hypothetical protein
MTTFSVLMPHWPLSLPSPAVPTLPSLSRRSSSSIAIESPSRRPSPSSCRRAVHHCQVAITPSIVVHHRCACGPSLLCSCRSSSSIPVKSLPSIPSSLSGRCAAHQRRVAVASSIAVNEPSIAVHCRQSVHCCPPVAATPYISVESIAVKSPSRRLLPSIAIHRPSPLSRRCIVHCSPRHQAVYRRRIAVAPSTVHRRSASITDVLSIAVALTIAVEPSIAIAPSIAVSHLASCCVASRHADASRPPVQEFPHGMFNLFLMCGTIL